MIRSIPLSPSESSAPIHPHYSPYPESYKRIRGILAYQIGKRTQPLPQRQVVVVQIQTYHQFTKACWTGIATTPPPTYLSSKKMMLVDNRHSKSSIYDKRKTKKKRVGLKFIFFLKFSTFVIVTYIQIQQSHPYWKS
jgi:hypothetical protein